MTVSWALKQGDGVGGTLGLLLNRLIQLALYFIGLSCEAILSPWRHVCRPARARKFFCLQFLEDGRPAPRFLQH